MNKKRLIIFVPTIEDGGVKQIDLPYQILFKRPIYDVSLITSLEN
jgi:hypothetical protein